MCFPQIVEAVEFAISLYVVKNSSQPIRTFMGHVAHDKNITGC